MLVIQAHTHRKRKSFGSEQVIKGGLMEHGSVPDRSVKLALNRQCLSVDDITEYKIHSHRSHTDGWHIFISHTVYHTVQPCQSILTESYRSFCIEPLIESAYASSPLPAATGFGLEYQFLTYGLGVLFLNHSIDILLREILVQIHLIFQILKSRHTAENEIICLMLQIQSTIQQITFVSAFLVIGNFADIVLTILFPTHQSGVRIRITALIGKLIIQGKVQFQILFRKINGTKAPSKFITFVDFAVVAHYIFKETALMVIKQISRKGKPIGNTVIVTHGSLIIIIGSGTQSQVCSLISERRLGVDTDQAAHRITSVESSLRSA